MTLMKCRPYEDQRLYGSYPYLAEPLTPRDQRLASWNSMRTKMEMMTLKVRILLLMLLMMNCN